MSVDLGRIELRHAALSGRVVLARMGKDPTVALDTRDATNDFLQALVGYVFGQLPAPGAAGEVEFGGGDEQYVLTLKRKPVDQDDEARTKAG
jgi:hypothetical protein